MLRRYAVFSGVFGKTEAKIIRKETSVSFFCTQKRHTNGIKEKRRKNICIQLHNELMP